MTENRVIKPLKPLVRTRLFSHLHYDYYSLEEFDEFSDEEKDKFSEVHELHPEDVAYPEEEKLWHEMEQALAGCNQYGGHEMEIYVSRFGGDSTDASNKLHGLLHDFATSFDCDIIVEGIPLEDWSVCEVTRRIHITIKERKKC